uniref:hypothetical protein n=1 Tax=Thaumasiovibrio occultus TaxID=1891184 RepID=UPI000B35F107|nr:hypothetical protein [Thaumasiovibrio occultus]
MSKRDAFYQGITGDQGVIWPETPQAQQAQLEALFGATTMGVLDTVVSRRFTDDEQHNRLVKEVAASTLYWLFCKLDQFPGAHLTLAAESLDEPAHSLGVVNDEELRLLFFDWLEQFSDTVTEADL